MFKFWGHNTKEKVTTVAKKQLGKERKVFESLKAYDEEKKRYFKY